MKEKYENDKIINNCKEVMKMLNETLEEEIRYNEPELYQNYDKIKENIINIVEDRIKYLNFWEEK